MKPTRQMKVAPGSYGQRFMDRFMNQPFEFNGETTTRARVYEWFQKNGFPSRAADYWLIGAERAAKP